MTAPAEVNERLNVVGTRNAVDLAGALGAEHLHHVSSVAAAGEFKGLFREDMFDEGQKLPSAYHRTKFESEKLVREQSAVPWRVYRPAIVVGHSQTGEMDKIDGPYYFFKAIKKARFALPEWMPLVGPELGYTNIVPVDFVAARAGPHRPSARPRRPGVPPHEPEGDARRRVAERVRQGRPRAAAGDPRRQAPDRRAAQGHGLDAHEAAPGARHPQHGARRLRHPARGARAHGDPAPVRHARHRARARRLGHRGARAGDVRRQAVGLLGAHARSGPLQGPLVSPRRSTGARSSSPARRAASAARRR